MAEIGDVTEVTDILQGAYEINWKIPKFSSISVENGEFYNSPPFSFAGESWSLRIYPDGRLKDFIGCIGIYLLKRTGSSPVSIGYTLGFKGFNEGKFTEHHRTYVFDKSYHGVPDCMSRKGLLRRKSILMPDDVLTVFCNLKYLNATDSSDETCASGSSASCQDNMILEDYKQMFLKQENCDVVVKVKGQDFPAHKIILAARSPVLASMFRVDMKEKKTNTVDIEDVDPSTFPDFLGFVYYGDGGIISAENVFSLFTAADKYHVPNLREKCVAFMKENLSLDNICETLTIALLHGEKELIDLATNFFVANAEKIVTTVKWQLFNAENPTYGNELFVKCMASNRWMKS